jgi:hypothetical protein
MGATCGRNLRPQVCNILSIKLETEVMWETCLVAANLFEKPFGGHAIEFREIAIEHDLGTTNRVDGSS